MLRYTVPATTTCYLLQYLPLVWLHLLDCPTVYSSTFCNESSDLLQYRTVYCTVPATYYCTVPATIPRRDSYGIRYSR